MKFFLDTANLDQIREASELGVLDGVTTNPSLMAKEGIKGIENQYEHYRQICEIVQGDVSAEVIATDYDGMIREGRELAALDEHIVVKLPCTEAGIKAVKHFSDEGIRTTQHIMQCAEAGADVVTCPLSAILGLLKHPLTDAGLAKFLEDFKRING